MNCLNINSITQIRMVSVCVLRLGLGEIGSYGFIRFAGMQVNAHKESSGREG